MQDAGETLYEFLYKMCLLETETFHCFISNIFQFLICNYKMWFEWIPLLCILSIPFTEAYLVFTCFVNNIVGQVDILLIIVRIERYGRDISQFLNVVENIIDWCINIKIHLFDHIRNMGNYLRCGFTIVILEMLEVDVDGILYGVGITIAQVRNVLCFDVHDYFLH